MVDTFSDMLTTSLAERATLHQQKITLTCSNPRKILLKLNKNHAVRRGLADLLIGIHLLNPLPTNDAPMRHDFGELSISLWEFIWGV